MKGEDKIVCKACGDPKLRSEFYLRQPGDVLVHAVCRICYKEKVKKRYESIRLDPEFKKQNRARVKEWVKNNYELFKKRQKIRQKIYSQKLEVKSRKLEYYQKNKEKLHKKAKLKRDQNLEFFRKKQREYYQKNKERAKEYYLKNKEKILEKAKKYNELNRETVLERKRQYYYKNKT